MGEGALTAVNKRNNKWSASSHWLNGSGAQGHQLDHGDKDSKV